MLYQKCCVWFQVPPSGKGADHRERVKHFVYDHAFSSANNFRQTCSKADNFRQKCSKADNFRQKCSSANSALDEQSNVKSEVSNCTPNYKQGRVADSNCAYSTDSKNRLQEKVPHYPSDNLRYDCDDLGRDFQGFTNANECTLSFPSINLLQTKLRSLNYDKSECTYLPSYIIPLTSTQQFRRRPIDNKNVRKIKRLQRSKSSDCFGLPLDERSKTFRDKIRTTDDVFVSTNSFSSTILNSRRFPYSSSVSQHLCKYLPNGKKCVEQNSNEQDVFEGTRLHQENPIHVETNDNISQALPNKNFFHDANKQPHPRSSNNHRKAKRTSRTRKLLYGRRTKSQGDETDLARTSESSLSPEELYWQTVSQHEVSH